MTEDETRAQGRTQDRTQDRTQGRSPQERLVRSYFAACSRGDADAVAEHFTDDAVVYDVNHRPARGASGIGAFFSRVRDRWAGAVWEVNGFVGDDQDAAIEWTMRGHQDGRPFVVRGSEHYAFRDGLIAQIRQYWVFRPDDPSTGLVDYPYDDDARFAAYETGGQVRDAR